MSVPRNATLAVLAPSNGPHQAKCDTVRSTGHENDVALRYQNGATLSEARTGRAAHIDRERELTVTSALSLPSSSSLTSSWPGSGSAPAGVSGQDDVNELLLGNDRALVTLSSRSRSM